MRRESSKLTMILLILTLCFAVTAGAVTVDPTMVTWKADPGYRLTLTVSGPGDFHLRQDFEPGAAPGFGAFSGSGDFLADGVYAWELTPSPVKGASRSDAKRSDESALRAVKGSTRSGYFTLAGGAFLSPDVPEKAEGADKDQTILDDLIVDGSACIGFDCVNGESFGFDTLRLKENNLRVRFQDTSSSSSFPTNDWQLTANDSSNGGAEKFSIDDIDGGRTPFTIEAGAPSHSLYVDDGGRIGLGTSTPSVEIHVVDGDTPTLRLEQNGSSGFTPQTWDVAGNETNFFIRDVTNGSALPIRLRPGAPTSALDIDDDGNLGVGTASPTEEIHVLRSSGNAAIRLETTESTGGDWIFRVQNTGVFQFRENAGGTIPFRLGNGAQNNLLNVGMSADGTTAVSDEINISGDLIVAGACSDLLGGDGGNDGCDGVFQPDYPLESIAEHAAFMWENSHLPAVGPTAAEARWNLARKSAGILNELEKAHIYIEQLNDRINELEARVEGSETTQE